MSVSDLERLVETARDEATADRFRDRVTEQADRLREEITAGEFDSPGYAVGLELEAYAVDDERRLVPLPEAVFGDDAGKELGVHNVELNTDPDPFDGTGLIAQAERIRERTGRVREAVAATGRELVLDAMWTVPPTEGSRAYLCATRQAGTVPVAERMRADPRYVAIDAELRAAAGGNLPLSVPGVEASFPSILFESLATSIQPHLQVPAAAALPRHFNLAVRTLGPVLALATNSPFLPPDLYDVDEPAALVETTHHELRIAVFEESVNHTAAPKVRVPRDIRAPTDAVDRVVADDLVAPFLREAFADGPRGSLADEVWEFDLKRSTYWRWVRCVIGGDPVGGGDERSLRLEYRPLPTQPTVTDVVGLQALVAGLVRGLVAADHPLTELPWRAAEESFYAAAHDGLDADLAWVTADGDRTDDHELLYDEVFEFARRGLEEAGLSAADIDAFLDPIAARRAAGVTPSVWKKTQVRERLADGADLATAIEGMQREYVRLSHATDSFAEWV